MLNRYKGLDLADGPPEELSTEVSKTIWEAVTKTIPKKKRYRRQSSCLKRTFKWLRREAKGKGEKDRYTQLNPESQRIERRDRKAF